MPSARAHWANSSPDTAGGRIKEHRVAGWSGTASFSRHARGCIAQERRGGLCVADRIGNTDKLIGGIKADRGVSAKRPVGIGDAIADLDAGRARTKRLDDPCPLVSEDRRKLLHLERAASEIDLDEVQPDCRVTDEGFARPRPPARRWARSSAPRGGHTRKCVRLVPRAAI